MGPSVRKAVNSLRQFMFEYVYEPEGQGELGATAKEIIHLLHEYYANNPREITTPDIGDGRSVIDQVASMTDLYALRQVEYIDPNLANRFREALN
jgi:dGTPase